MCVCVYAITVVIVHRGTSHSKWCRPLTLSCDTNDTIRYLIDVTRLLYYANV